MARGPNAVRALVYVGRTPVVIAIAVGAMVARPTSITPTATVSEGDLAAARSARLTNVLVTESVLWSAALVTMLV